jgi:prevent-host-death family protein
MTDLSLSQARWRLNRLVRRAAADRQRVTITDHGRPAAVLVNAEELADLEEAAALAGFEARQAAGEQRMIPHEQAIAHLERLGLNLEPTAKTSPGSPSAGPPAR